MSEPVDLDRANWHIDGEGAVPLGMLRALVAEVAALRQENLRLRTSPTAMAALHAGDRTRAEELLDELGDRALEVTIPAYREVADLAERCLRRRRG